MVTRYFLVAFALAWVITIPLALQGQGVLTVQVIPPPAQWLIGFVPVIAAWWVTRGTAERRAWKAAATHFRAPGRWYLFAVCVPWLILGAVIALRKLAGTPAPELRAGPSVLIFAVVWLLLAWGEEAGWRAFALPRMVAERGFWYAATVLGVLWCVWHYPKLFSSPYLHLDAPGIRALALFSLQIIIANYLICWLYLRSGSVGVPTVFHTSWNLVSTVYAFAAMDQVMTALLAAVTIAALAVGRKGLP